MEPGYLDDPVARWATRPVVVAPTRVANAMTVDVEDYFQVEAFFDFIDRREWDGRECRVEQNTDRILELFGAAGVSATFFTLGWVAERYPALIRRIVSGGHELASHGFAHFRADRQSREEFKDDIVRAKAVLEDRAGVSVKGYRATSFSITRGNLWAHDVIEEAGYVYSSSVSPIRHDLYGIPEAPRFAFYPLAGRPFVEIPATAVRRLGTNMPCGGGFFRLFPYWFSKLNLRAVNLRDHQPCVFYVHPWELDPGQPRVAGISLKAGLRHYTNLARTENRLARLLRDFSWNRIDRIYPLAA